jgi:F-type H+-transporting ATPase subunit delta
MNGKMITIARPYAAAAFEYALANKDIVAWEAMLQSAVLVAQTPAVMQLLASPKLTSVQLADFFCDIMASQLNDERRNFMRLLAENHRLAALPDITELFRAYRAAQEKTITVNVVSATALTDVYQTKLIQALAKRLQRQVELQCEVDPLVLGGAIIRAGDTVIDGSVRGKLTRLLDFL